MVTVEKALQVVKNNCLEITESEELDVFKALDRVLSEDVKSAINMPPFNQSAMDGYAIVIDSTKNEYSVVGEVKAGDAYHPQLKPGEAVRIFTGAPVPDSCNAVIMQEKVKVLEDRIVIDSEIKINSNIRPKGEQVITGAVALKKGVTLTPSAIGYLTTLGVQKVKVVRVPNISIVITGNELVATDQELLRGQIYESNGVMLQACLNKLNYHKYNIVKVEDDYQQTKEALNYVINTSDLVLVSGGISVGDYDFVGSALNELGVDEKFYKVKQKPGKPLFFGMKNQTHIFALPGNPASALNCFYVYVYKALGLITGKNNHDLVQVRVKLQHDYFKKGNRLTFLKAFLINDEVVILDKQSSAMLSSFTEANALVCLDELEKAYKKGDHVSVMLIP